MTRHLPFSNDYEREEAFALGVINGTSPGFPDTLRQFRVPNLAADADSLAPLAQRSEPPAALPPPPAPRYRAVALSLALGFGVGVAIAFAAFSFRAQSEAPRVAAMATTPVVVSTATATGNTEPKPSAPAASPAPRSPASTVAQTPDRPTAPLANAAQRGVATTATPVAVSPAEERRWLLDHARSEQRLYHIATADRFYRQILAHAPQDSEALSGLGELDLLRGTVDLADQHFQAALNANSNYIPALIAAADIRWQSGRTEEARQAYLDIVDHYSADSYPPYVALRSVPVTTPVCER